MVIHGLTYDNVTRCGRATDWALWHSSVAAARHTGKLRLRHHLQTMATLPSPWREVDVVWKKKDKPLNSAQTCLCEWLNVRRLTCPRVCAVDLRLCGVPEDDGSYTVEAVFVSVILQSRLIWAHRVVLIVTSAHNQLRDTELLLQYWDSRAITYRGKNRGKHRHTPLF